MIMKYSVIMLLEENNEDFAQFVEELFETFSSQSETFEILIVANGLEGFLKSEMQKLGHLNGRLKAFALNKKTSQAVCLKSILRESSGKIIVVCGSYQQITRESLLKMLDALGAKSDIISPWRQHRVDPSFNQFQSRIFNYLVELATKSNIHDLSCTVKVFKREVLEETELYGNMYRFLPIVAARKGFKNIEIECEHYEERGKTGFYSLSEYFERLIDIFTLYFNTRFSKKPLRFFSTIGAVFILFSLFITVFVFFQKIFFGVPIGHRLVLLLAIFLMVLGTQAASVGLLGEIVAFTHGRGRKDYTIEKEI